MFVRDVMCILKNLELTNTLNYYKPDDWRIDAFTRICRKFCEFTIDQKKLTITYILDTPEKWDKYIHAFNNFNWND